MNSECRICRAPPTGCCCSFDKVIKPCQCQFSVHENCLKNEILQAKEKEPKLIERSIGPYKQVRCPSCKYLIMFNEDFSKNYSHFCSDRFYPFFTIMFSIFFTTWLIQLALLAEELYYGYYWWEVYPFWMIILLIIPIPLLIYLGKKMYHHGTEIFIQQAKPRQQGPTYNMFLSGSELQEEKTMNQD